jgi:hypothetical protein
MSCCAHALRLLGFLCTLSARVFATRTIAPPAWTAAVSHRLVAASTRRALGNADIGSAPGFARRGTSTDAVAPTMATHHGDTLTRRVNRQIGDRTTIGSHQVKMNQQFCHRRRRHRRHWRLPS